MVEHPAARALTGFLLVRGGVHQVAYARALERLTGADLMKLFPSPRIPTDKIPECQPHIKRGDHLRLYRFSPDDYKEAGRSLQRPSPGDRRGADRRGRPHPTAPPHTTCPPSRRCSLPTTPPRRSLRSLQKLREQAGLPKQPTGLVSKESADLMDTLTAKAKS